MPPQSCRGLRLGNKIVYPDLQHLRDFGVKIDVVNALPGFKLSAYDQMRSFGAPQADVCF